MSSKSQTSALVIKNSQVLLIKRTNTDKEHWSFPSGEEQEFSEETGLPITNVIAKHSYFDQADKFTYNYTVVEVEEGMPKSTKPGHEPHWTNISTAVNMHNLYPLAVKDYLRTLSHH